MVVCWLILRYSVCRFSSATRTATSCPILAVHIYVRMRKGRGFESSQDALMVTFSGDDAVVSEQVSVYSPQKCYRLVRVLLG